MGFDKEKQAKAIQMAQKIIEEAEKKRASARAVRGVEEFSTGNLDVFLNEENIQNVSRYVYQTYQEYGLPKIQPQLAMLKDGVSNADQAIRERVAMTVSLVSNHLQQTEDVEAIVIFHNLLVDWLKNEEHYINGFGIICRQIQESALFLLRRRLWKEVDTLLVTIYQIQNGIIEKNGSIHGMVVKIQENLASKEILEKLTEIYLNDSDLQRDEAENLLTYLGRRAVIYLLNRLMHSNEKKERIKLIRLIPYAGTAAVPVLVDCLQKEPPWFVIRNIIFIISEIGDTSLYSMIRPYLSHTDIRVQQQVVSCIAKFGGSKLKDRLLEALPAIHDEIKVQLVMELGQMEGEEIGDAFVDLLRKRHTFTDRVSENLMRKILISLKFFPNKHSVDAIKEVINEREGQKSENDRVLATARESLSVVEPKVRRRIKSTGAGQDFVSFDEESVDLAERERNMRDLEEKVQKLVEAGDLEEACSIVFNHIRITAREKDFTTAEELRDKLLEINPMALNEVIKAGEIIEEEKSSSITNHHLTIWADLYDSMTTEEFNALYYAMRPEHYANGEAIVNEGETDPSLYFINSGFVSLACNCGKNQIFLKRLQPGDIVGVNEFFSISVWTVSLIAQSDCQINVLEREALNALEENHVGLHSKLHDFCLTFDNIHELIKMSGSERRDHPRYTVSVIITSTLLDPYGNPGKRSFKGELLDISRGGLCFSIHISSKENARLLLGRQIITDVKIGRKEKIKCAGVIVGVKFQDHVEQDFSVHVRFHKQLQQADVMKVVQLYV